MFTLRVLLNSYDKSVFCEYSQAMSILCCDTNSTKVYWGLRYNNKGKPYKYFILLVVQLTNKILKSHNSINLIRYLF